MTEVTEELVGLESRHWKAAMQLLLEDQCFFHSEAELEAYDLIVFPDKVRFNAMLEQKVKAYLDRGGKILLSHESGFRKVTTFP